MGVVGYYHPAVKTAGFKMIDVIGCQCFMIFVRAENLIEKSVLKLPERFTFVFDKKQLYESKY